MGLWEEVLWEFTDPRLEGPHQALLYSACNAAGMELSVEASRNFCVLEETGASCLHVHFLALYEVELDDVLIRLKTRLKAVAKVVWQIAAASHAFK